ncbi:hypothetical protein KCP73_10460 [Salmonella enterica subsp. enterica]|nr:hypothetical protein KCP73_10460 [Salmonella enterica subsp. enterica]
MYLQLGDTARKLHRRVGLVGVSPWRWLAQRGATLSPPGNSIVNRIYREILCRARCGYASAGDTSLVRGAVRLLRVVAFDCGAACMEQRRVWVLLCFPACRPLADLYWINEDRRDMLCAGRWLDAGDGAVFYIRRCVGACKVTRDLGKWQKVNRLAVADRFIGQGLPMSPAMPPPPGMVMNGEAFSLFANDIRMTQTIRISGWILRMASAA